MNPLRPPETTPDDPRLGHLLGRKVAEGEPARVALIGFPTDVGVRRNGGRPGAAAAPAEIRRFFARMTPDARAGQRFIDLVMHTEDLGDIPVSPELEADQERLAAVVAQQLARGAFVIVLGGGHETAFGHFLGYARGAHAVEILNFDAHPDVRHLKAGRGHSGSPFRQALEHPSGRCRGYRVAGLLPHSTAAAHLAYVVERRGAGVWREDLTAESVAQLFARASSPTYVSFDIDAVDQAHAPGVSAPAAGGMSVDLWLEAAYQAGFCNSVTSCDLVEVNPNYDRDGQTARLAALTIWQVLRGLVARPPASSTQPAATADTPTPVRRTRLPRKR